MTRTGIGLRVAQWRSLAGMSQQELGRRAGGYTKQYISAIENGKRPIDTRHLLADLAHGLGVEVNHLAGQPFPPTSDRDLLNYTVVPLIRTALDDPDEEVPVRPAHELDAAAADAMAARMACNMTAIGQILPALITETRQMWLTTGDPAAGMNLVKALVTGALALKAAGFVDLAIRMAEQATGVADGLGAPVAVAAARFTTAQCALATGNRRRSARLATAGADDMDRYARTARLAPSLRNEAIAWMGMLHLHASLTDASLPGGDPDGHLSAAADAARRVDGDPWLMECSPANVDTWRIGVALESGQPERAPELARRVNMPLLRTPQRRSRVHLDHGGALFLLDDYPAATQQLLLADRAAPGDLRNRGTAVEAVVHMVRHSRLGSDELRDLAVRVGVDVDAVRAGY